jgi:hypothetical protein
MTNCEDAMQETTNDYLVRILARDAGLLGLACTTTDLVNEAARRHAGHPVATEVLAQGLTAAALMGALLKIQQRVALKFEGDGPMRKMVVESDSYGRVRGYVARPELEGTARLHRPTPVEAIGHNGLLTVVKDLRLANLHTGIVPMSSHALAEDLAFYLNQSEQTPSLVEIDEVLAENGAEQSRAAVAGGRWCRNCRVAPRARWRAWRSGWTACRSSAACCKMANRQKACWRSFSQTWSTKRWRRDPCASSAPAAGNVRKRR